MGFGGQPAQLGVFMSSWLAVQLLFDGVLHLAFWEAVQLILPFPVWGTPGVSAPCECGAQMLQGAVVTGEFCCGKSLRLWRGAQKTDSRAAAFLGKGPFSPLCLDFYLVSFLQLVTSDHLHRCLCLFSLPLPCSMPLFHLVRTVSCKMRQGHPVWLAQTLDQRILQHRRLSCWGHPGWVQCSFIWAGLGSLNDGEQLWGFCRYS